VTAARTSGACGQAGTVGAAFDARTAQPVRPVDLWSARLDQPDAQVDRLVGACSADEVARARRLVDRRRGRHWLVGRAILREVLGDYTGLSAGAIEIIAEPGRKPRLPGSPPPLHFNLSHSGSVIVVAVTDDREVGVDVERVDPRLDIDVITRRFLSTSERAHLHALSGVERRVSFFRLWTAREACLKAAGRGLGLAPGVDEVEALLTWRPVRAELRDPDGSATSWSLIDVPAPTGYVATLAIEGGPAAVRLRRWHQHVGASPRAPCQRTQARVWVLASSTTFHTDHAT